MMKTEFQTSDLSLLTINLLTYRIFTRLPMTLIKSADSSAPLSSLVCGAVLVFGIFLISLCIYKCTQGNLLDITQSVFGNWGRIIVSLIIVLYLVLSQIFALSEFSTLIKLISFPTSPMWFVAGFLILGSILAAIGSSHSIVRLHGVFMPFILAVFALLIVSTIVPFEHSTPIFPESQTSARDILSHSTLYSDIILLFLIAPADNKPKTVKKIASGGVIALVFNTLFFLSFILRIPATIAQNGQFPVYLLMKEVYFGRFFQRLDAVLLLSCAVSILLYMSLSLNLLSKTLSQGLKLPDTKLVPVISGILIYLIVVFKWFFKINLLQNLIFVFSMGVLITLIICAVFAKMRGAVNEKR